VTQEPTAGLSRRAEIRFSGAITWPHTRRENQTATVLAIISRVE